MGPNYGRSKMTKDKIGNKGVFGLHHVTCSSFQYLEFQFI